MSFPIEPTARRRGRRGHSLVLAVLTALVAAAVLIASPLGARRASAKPAGHAAAAAAEAQSGKGAGAQAGSQVPVNPRVALLEQFRQQMRSGKLDAAAAAAADYLKRFPFDGIMQYNLACIEARRGAKDAAFAALDKAMASPLADPRQAETDPDLVALRGDRRFADLLRGARDRLQKLASERRAELRDNVWGDDLTLAPNDGTPAAPDWPRVTIKLMANSGGLQIRATVRDTRVHGRRQPWRNGDGFRVTIAPPPRTGTDNDRSFVFGFGSENGLPVGALVEMDGHAHPTQVVELSPKIRIEDEGRQASYTMFVPWSATAPYAPPVDTLLGINVSYLSVGDDRLRRTVSLLPDPSLETGGGPWRRCAPLGLTSSDQSTPILRGAVANAVVGSGPLGIRLVAWLPRACDATLRVEIEDVSGHSVVSSGEQEAKVKATAGINRWQRAADLSQLPTGPFHLKARLIPAGGDTLRWQTDLVRFDPGWLDDARARAKKLIEGDRSTVEYRLEAIDKELSTREPRTPPDALATTLVETTLLLRRAEKTGTVLPDSADVVAAYRDSAGALQPCGVHIPRGYAPRGPHRLLVVLPGAGPGGPRVARELAIGIKPAGDLVVVWPQLSAEGGALPGSAVSAREVLDAVRWARARFQAEAVQLAGIGIGAADALEASLLQPAAFSRVLLMTGTAGDLWPQESTAQEASRIAPRLNQLVYTVFEPGPTAPSRPTGGLLGSRPAAGSDSTSAAGAATGTPRDDRGLAAALERAGLRVDRRPQLGAELDIRSAASMLAHWASESPPAAAKGGGAR